jgi:L-seryl-tRNA(Ser) seleniumtransferase
VKLESLPKVDEVLKRPEVRALVDGGAPRWAVVEAVRGEIARARQALIADGKCDEPVVDLGRVKAAIGASLRPSLRPVVNATGVVLHTNLGRAPLAEAAVRRLVEAARGYVNLEYSVDERRRGSRHDHLRALVARLTSAEDAVVVNNCAAAVMLALGAHAAGKQAIVSRGELVEIGGSFRVPDVMRAAGVTLVEVGTTNRTHLADYAAALDAWPDAVLVKVHQSNFTQIGFVAEVGVAELATLAKERSRPLLVDLGVGALADDFGVPSVRSIVAAGADLVCFSGDKLLGGPQAGIVAGSTTAVAPLRKHPLMRAVRPSRLTIAALEATLELHRDGEIAAIPALAMLAADDATLRARAEKLAAASGCELVRVDSAVGGGAAPTHEPASWAVAAPVAADAILRAADPPIVGRIAEDRLLLDVRTIDDSHISHVAAMIVIALSPAKESHECQ